MLFFGWQTETHGGNAALVHFPKYNPGAIVRAGSSPGIEFCILIDDFECRLEEVERLGGKVLEQPSYSGWSREVRIEDVAGNRFLLLEG